VRVKIRVRARLRARLRVGIGGSSSSCCVETRVRTIQSRPRSCIAVISMTIATHTKRSSTASW